MWLVRRMRGVRGGVEHRFRVDCVRRVERCPDEQRTVRALKLGVSGIPMRVYSQGHFWICIVNWVLYTDISTERWLARAMDRTDGTLAMVQRISFTCKSGKMRCRDYRILMMQQQP